MIEHQTAWRPAGELGKWTIGNPAVVMIGDTLFVHGGISAAYATMPLDEINRRVAAALTAREIAPESIINDPMGPLWYRGLITRAKGADDVAGRRRLPRPPAATRARAAPLDRSGNRHGAQGLWREADRDRPHADASGISVLHGGKLVRIDTGISQYYGGTPSYLEIAGDQVTPAHGQAVVTRCAK